MSGIAGLFRLDGRPALASEIDAMLATIAHRGPDGCGSWREDGVALGHRMLFTTPESLEETLPFVIETADGPLVITADARLDNREELLALLDLADRARGQSIADSELILRAFARWGERCVEHLLGDFAFVIWEGPRRQLFCARDHFGVKPFYYHHSPGRLFCFGSEIKALLALDDVPQRLNTQRVAEYLAPAFENKEITFYEDIVRLAPAHAMVVTGGAIRRWEYWALDPEREIRLRSDGEYAAAFRDAFTEAVRCRLRSAFPLGSMLSGGLDSSSIVCVARELSHEPLHTFSLLFNESPECDERVYIQAVISQGQLRAHFVPADHVSPFGEVQQMLWHEDEPFIAPNLFLHWALYRAASGEGMRVLLDGLDGDTTVSHGLDRFEELASERRFGALFCELAALGYRSGRWRWDLWRRYGMAAAPRWARTVWQERRRVCVPAHGNSSVGARPGRADHVRRLRSGIVSAALEVADKAAAAFGLEPRYPFFDRRLAEFCLAMPARQKLRSGWTRYVMRQAMLGAFPRRVCRRGSKSNLSPNFNRTLLSSDRCFVLDSLRNARGVEMYLAPGALEEAYRHFVATNQHVDALTLWRGLMLAAWLDPGSVLNGGSMEQQKKNPSHWQQSATERDEGEKKSYSPPQLVIHGDVEKITGALAGAAVDGLLGSI